MYKGAGVVVVGSLNLDHVVTVERLPRPGETVVSSGYVLVPGGKGLNQAVAAARQGVPTAMIGCVGTDRAGEMLAEVLTGAGVALEGVRRVARTPSGVALVTVAPGGINTVVVAAGANEVLSPADVAATSGVVDRAGVVLTQLEVPLATVRAALLAGSDAGAVTVLNPAPAVGELTPELLGLVDVLIPNETEAQLLTGEADPAQAAATLVARGCRAVIVTLGARGALCLESSVSSEAVLLPSFQVAAVDTTGAGDAFCGALAAALVRSGRLVDGALWDAARRGVAAGALAATVLGAVASLPDAEAVDQLLASGRRAN
jgi:ribokinase